MITFKEPKLETEFQQVDPKMEAMIDDCATIAHYHWQRDIVVTSVYRNDASTHNCKPPYRFVDFRSRDWRQDQRDELMYSINRRYIYDPSRPDYHCLIEHDTGQGRHFHAQVHPNTVIQPDVEIKFVGGGFRSDT